MIFSFKELARLVEKAQSQMASLSDKIVVHDVNIGRDIRLGEGNKNNSTPVRKSSLPHSVSKVNDRSSRKLIYVAFCAYEIYMTQLFPNFRMNTLLIFIPSQMGLHHVRVI